MKNCLNSVKSHYICVHDISVMTKNITLTADETVIRKAREKAFKNKTTLNNEFSLWLEKYIEEKQSGKNFTEIMKKLDYARLKKKPSREEMNER